MFSHEILESPSETWLLILILITLMVMAVLVFRTHSMVQKLLYSPELVSLLRKNHDNENSAPGILDNTENNGVISPNTGPVDSTHAGVMDSIMPDSVI